MMKVRYGLGALLALALLADTLPAQGGRGGGRRGFRGRVPEVWHSDYTEARAVARRTGKPMMLVYRCAP